MRVGKRQDQDIDVLSFEGEFDASKAPVSELDDLIEAGRRRIVCSFGELRFIASPVIGHLVKAAKRLKGLGGELVLSEPSRFMLATIRTLGLDQIFEIFPTDDAAVAHFAKSGPRGDRGSAGEVSFRLLDAPEATAVGRILAIHADGLTLGYPADPDRERIDPEDLRVGRALSLRFRQPFVERDRTFEAEAEIAEGSAGRYRLRYTRIADRDREALSRLAPR